MELDAADTKLKRLLGDAEPGKVPGRRRKHIERSKSSFLGECLNGHGLPFRRLKVQTGSNRMSRRVQ